MIHILAAFEAPGLPYHNSTSRGQRIFLAQLQVAACWGTVLIVLPSRGGQDKAAVSHFSLSNPACSIDFGDVAPVSIMMLSSSVAAAVRALSVILLDLVSILAHTSSRSAFSPNSSTCISLLEACAERELEVPRQEPWSKLTVEEKQHSSPCAPDGDNSEV